MAIQVKYEGNNVSLPEGTTIEEAKEALSRIYPEVANAEGTEDEDGNITFKVQSGTKGADDVKVKFGDTSISLPAGTTVEEARDALASIHPEVVNATAEEEDGVIVFKVKSGTKGN